MIYEQTFIKIHGDHLEVLSAGSISSSGFLTVSTAMTGSAGSNWVGMSTTAAVFGSMDQLPVTASGDPAICAVATATAPSSLTGLIAGVVPDPMFNVEPALVNVMSTSLS